jgi:predicted metal-dependent hydrolase
MDRRAVRDLVERLNRDAEQIARQFGLRYKSVTAERANVTSRYGSCCEDGAIKIRLRHAVTGKPLKYSSLVNTLCHELAHLRYFHHGERFKSFYLQILEYARAQRIYRPGRPAEGAASRSAAPPRAREEVQPPGPVQLGLF